MSAAEESLKTLFRELEGPASMLVGAVILWSVLIMYSCTTHLNKTTDASHQSQMTLNGISCPRCVYVPKGVQRLESSKLSEGPMVELPTNTYLTHLAKVCENKADGYPRSDCNWRLGEIRYGVDDVSSRTNPLYGRPPFTDAQLKYVLWSAERVGQLLSAIEAKYSLTQEREYLMREYTP